MPVNKERLRRQSIFLFVGIGVLGLFVIGTLYFHYVRSRWERNWLTGIPCLPPCWEGITPGQTTIEEATQLLQWLPQMDELNRGQYEPAAYALYYWENWRHAPGGGSVLYDRDTSVVFLVVLAFPHDFTLGEVIERYGEPSHIVALAARNFEKTDVIDYTLELYWQSQGIVLDLARSSPSHLPVLNQNLKFHSVRFFEPTQAGLEQTVIWSNPGWLQFLETWQGFRDFRDYCHVVGGQDPQVCEVGQP